MKAENCPILVTGASSGIGRHLAQYLAERGHTVYATARKEADLADLGRIENVIPVQLDVRNTQQIHAALDFVVQQGRGLYGLVNNAGVGQLGMLSTWTDEEMLDVFDINVFGPHRMTNAFVRLLIEAGGRVVNIGSQGGMITRKYYGPYTMTKHALEAYTVALGLELAPYGVQVSIVQPGGIVSQAGANAIDSIIARFQRATPPFKDEADQVLAALSQPAPEDDKDNDEEEEEEEEEEESEANRKPSSPEIVAVAVYDALFSARPKRCYLVGTRWEGDRVIHALIEKLLDENDNPQHNYSRDELVALLDCHISQRGAHD